MKNELKDVEKKQSDIKFLAKKKFCTWGNNRKFLVLIFSIIIIFGTHFKTFLWFYVFIAFSNFFL
jgi:hypothetical protein